MDGFPEAALAATLQKTWHSSAAAVYRNWLQYVVAKKAEVTAFPALAVVSDSTPRQTFRTAVGGRIRVSKEASSAVSMVQQESPWRVVPRQRSPIRS